MKTLLLLSLTTAISNMPAQNSAETKKIDGIVAEIQEHLSEYKKTIKTERPDAFSYAYHQNGELKLVHVRSIDDMYVKEVKWYFDNGKMIFIIQESVDNSGILTNRERLYFGGNKMISWIKTDGTEYDPSSGEFKDLEKEVVTYGKKMFAENSK